MSGAATVLRPAVFASGVDLTPYVSSVRVTQDLGTVAKKFEVEFRAFHLFPADAVWDIYAAYDSARPQQGCLLYHGIAPPEEQPSGEVTLGQVPTFTVVGWEHIWLMQRRRPKVALVTVPSSGSGASRDATAAIQASGGGIGRYRIVAGVRTMHDAVAKLCALAGFRVSISTPNYPMRPWVVPEGSYWDAVAGLVNPFAPHVSYSAWQNQLTIADCLGGLMGAGPVMELPDKVETLWLRNQRRSQPSRVRVRQAPWSRRR